MPKDKKFYFDINGSTNFELVEIAKNNGIKLKINDIMMMNMLSKIKLKKNMNLILNLADLKQGGSHWVLFLIRDKKALYIDSFACKPSSEVIDFCLKYSLQLGYSNYICQKLVSSRCGIYCIQGLKYLQKTNGSNLYCKGNEYINKYEPLKYNKNERICVSGLLL
mgnify:CR=1 FL=1